MTKEELLKIVSKIIIEETKESQPSISYATVADDIEGWDSLAHGRIIIAIERACAVRLPDDKIFDLENVGDLITEVQKLVGKD